MRRDVGTERRGTPSLRCALASILCLSLLTHGCGGHTQQRDETPGGSGSRGGSSAIGGEPTLPASGASGAGGDASPEVEEQLAGCPDQSWSQACGDRLKVEVDFTGPRGLPSGAWAEPVQVPPLDRDPNAEPLPPVQPDQWDRSEVPADACVFKLHGLERGCLAPSMTLGFGSCEPLPPGQHRVIPFGFYESMHCAEGVAPGCPPPGSGAGDGQWWYLVPNPSAPSEATLVICSQLCMNFGPNGLACLQGPDGG
jgi:hypothetical protein